MFGWLFCWLICRFLANVPLGWATSCSKIVPRWISSWTAPRRNRETNGNNGENMGKTLEQWLVTSSDIQWPKFECLQWPASVEDNDYYIFFLSSFTLITYTIILILLVSVLGIISKERTWTRAKVHVSLKSLESFVCCCAENSCLSGP